jgi:CheY-like chemotaxis protein
MVKCLGQEGFAVETAASGEEGLRKARAERPALVTLDVLMPGMDGWAVLEELAYTLGASDFITKPIDVARLRSTVERYRGDDGRPHVLVVEDDENTRRLLRQALEKSGGFLEGLHQREEWRAIPVIVVTAKEISLADRERLSGRVRKILQKGAMGRRELVDLVRGVLKAPV